MNNKTTRPKRTTPANRKLSMDRVQRVVRRDLPLRAHLKGDRLIFEIGVATLAHAAEYCERFYDDEKHGVSGPPYVTVVDPNELAKDVIGKLEHEDEAGNSLLTRLLDDAIEYARDDGSLAFGGKRI